MRSAVLQSVLSIAMVGASLAAVTAQHGSRGSATFHGGVDLVVMDVAVADGNHEPVAALTGDDFSVFEDGVQQQVTFFATHQIPIDLALVFDTSASMAGELQSVQQCGMGFVESLSSHDRASVLELKERMNVLQPLTSVQSDLAAAMTRLAEGGETALYDGLYVALSELGARSMKESDIRSGVLVVITDGADTTSLLTFDQLLEQARQQGVAIYVVRLQGKALSMELTKKEIMAARRGMDTLAAETGGRVLAEQHGDLSSLCATIVKELARRYTVGYIPANTRRDGGYRRISVRITGHPDLIARTRAGYVSK